MDDKLNIFKQSALEMGYPQEEIDSFLQTTNQNLGETTPSVETFTKAAQNQGFSPEETSGFMNTPIQKKNEEPRTIGQYAQDPRLASDTSSLQGTGVNEMIGPKVSQDSIVGSDYTVNTRFGVKSGADVFSRGRNWGVDIGVGMSTPIATPPGDWEVVESFGGANPQGGYIGNAENNGYGNSVLLKSKETGETIRFSHLSQVNVKPGETLSNNEVIAYSGNSGNSSGPHLDVEYRNQQGYLADILTSPYGKYL